VALFFTILIDEVFYTYYRSLYNKFQQLTLYPKFTGNCTLACHTHLHPRYIFNEYHKPFNKTYHSSYLHTLNEAIPIMQKEVFDFFPNYMSEVDAKDIWGYCQQEIPFQHVVLT
jgi:hypothetical protein